MMQDFVRVFGSFEEATTILSGQRYETASLLIPLFFAVKQNVELDEQDSECAKILRSALKKSVDFYIKKYGYFQSSILSAVSFLDPRLRDNYGV